MPVKKVPLTSEEVHDLTMLFLTKNYEQYDIKTQAELLDFYESIRDQIKALSKPKLK